MKNKHYSDLGFVNLLTIVFVVLKLTGVINWSWLWVLSPLWIGAGIAIVIVGVVLLIAWRTDSFDIFDKYF